MAQREAMLEIQIIKDHSCGTYTIGEIDSINDEQIEKYLDSFGEFGYQELQNWLMRASAVSFNKIMKIRKNRNNGESCSNGSA